MVPVVRYMICCEDVAFDGGRPECVEIDCLTSNIVSIDQPPFPLLKETVCVFLVLTECYRAGSCQILVTFLDREHEEPVFGSSIRQLDFAGRSPLETFGVIFRLRSCPFPRAGLYSVQFWYDGQKVEERLLRLKARGM